VYGQKNSCEQMIPGGLLEDAGGLQGSSVLPMGPAPFWSVKPAKKLHPNKKKGKHKPKRLGSLEAWRSDKILEAAQQRMSPKKLPPKLSIDPLSVVGNKPTTSSPLFSQLPGARTSPSASPSASPTGRGSGGKAHLSPNGSNGSLGDGPGKRLGSNVCFPSPAGTPASLRRKREILASPSNSNHSPIPGAMGIGISRMTPEMEALAGASLGREKEAVPVDMGALDMGVPIVGMGFPVPLYADQPLSDQPPPAPTTEVYAEAAEGAAEGAETQATVERRVILEPSQRLDEGVLMGKLMEAEMTLRLKFDSGKELRRVQDKVRKGLDFIEELALVAKQLEVIEGLLFQELLARLNSMSPATFATATTPASPTLRAIRQENRALHGGGGSPPAGRVLVNRTPLPGQAHPEGAAQSKDSGPPRPMQAVVETLAYEKQQALIRNVANLRGLVRIKIEDNGDLALAKKALVDARLVFDNVWALANDLPVDSVDGKQEETSWPPSPGDDPSLDRRVTLVLTRLRKAD